MTEQKRQEMEMKEAVRAHKLWENITANCFYCYGSETMPKENLMWERRFLLTRSALGDHTYLTMCSKMRLNDWHVQICPLQHVWAQTDCDEEVTNEIGRFKQSLAAMAKSLVGLIGCCDAGQRTHLLRGGASAAQPAALCGRVRDGSEGGGDGCADLLPQGHAGGRRSSCLARSATMCGRRATASAWTRQRRGCCARYRRDSRTATWSGPISRGRREAWST